MYYYTMAWKYTQCKDHKSRCNENCSPQTAEQLNVYVCKSTTILRNRAIHISHWWLTVKHAVQSTSFMKIQEQSTCPVVTLCDQQPIQPVKRNKQKQTLHTCIYLDW